MNNRHQLQSKNQNTGSSRIFIFSIVLGVEYLSYMKSIETYARAFLPLDISSVGSVYRVEDVAWSSFFKVGF